MKAKDFDKEFERGQDITSFLDFTKARYPEQEQKRVNVDFPVWMIHSLDREARRLGVPRQSLIKMVISEHIEARGWTKSQGSNKAIERTAQ